MAAAAADPDAQLLDLLREEEGLAQIKSEVDDAIENRLREVEEGGATADEARLALRDELFWSDELSRKIAENQDARLALKLLVEQKREAEEARKAAAEQEHADALFAELRHLEDEFECAMLDREEEKSADRTRWEAAGGEGCAPLPLPGAGRAHPRPAP